ncbi:hypothetical protein [Acinetobacter soli]|uniref:hypothetical protein n=1 Tax=Acinetobacter soli TaxID=487316 RepID=UPI001F377C8B|nr:hypothetical protein [Acinetobacter soli]MCE6007609.1 hypothetical protein [Acinetobacter soli]
MNNYKIRVNNEAESREAQELFFELEYSWQGHGKKYKHLNQEWINANSNGFLTWGFTGVEAQKLITLPQLRDLVVLHRNDVKDANYKSHNDLYYVTDMYDYYFWNGHRWCESTQDSINGLIEIIKSPVEQGLISGADALRALADGKEVEVKDKENNWVRANNHHLLGMFLGNAFDFRLKPRTVKLEIEVPAPFEPKDGELFWHISPGYEKGFAKSMYDDRNVNTWQQFGAWRTEAEIKIVVEQLSKLKEHSK